MHPILQDTNACMEKALEHLQVEMSRVRTGRANTSLLDAVQVESYGQRMPLSHVATLSVPEPRMITIQPWDVSQIPGIEKAIMQAQLGLMPANDGKIIRLPVPALTEDRRKELVKVIKRHGEDAKVTVRNARRDANELFKKLEKAEDAWSEDDTKRSQADVQKSTDSYVKKIDTLIEKKEADIMTV